MLNQQTKKHIDNARQILVGVVPNPTSQIDQITNALIYKFMDDMDQASIKAGGEPSFFVKDLEKYAWTKIIDPKIGNQERMNLYSEALLKFSESKNLPELFRAIFKSAFLPYRSPETLGLFLKEIDHFDYSHPEELGNAYEYLLSIMSSQGDAGQFRTPRHIIDFMVDVVNPSKDDRILDPACGTGGFLVSSYKQILEQHDGKNDPDKKEKPLTPDERKKLMQNLEGYDIDPSMARIASVNMYLHQFKNPKIFQYDTLSSEERWDDKYDVILANPPFMSPKGGIKPHNRFTVPSTRSEVLFVDYIMNHLRPKGRAAIIVPEGVIFQSGSSYKELRKNLVQDGLYAVVSLPSGVFQPYSGVKTSILFFDNQLAKQTDELLFIKIENDGFALSAQRKEINKNDLPQAVEIFQQWRLGGKVESKIAVYVSKKEVAKNDDYNLSVDRYAKAIDYSNAKWPIVKLSNLFKTITPPIKIQKADFGINGKFPIIDQSQNEISGWTNNESSLIKPSKPLIIFGDHTCAVKYIEKPFAQGADGIKILQTNDNLLPKFLFYLLEVNPIESDGYKRHFSKLKETRIPLPPLEIQEQIIDELDSYQKIIDGAKQITQNWKPKINIDPTWPILELKDVTTKITDGAHFTPTYVETGVPFLRVTDITESNNSKKFIPQKEHDELIKRCNPEKGDVLYTKNGTIGISKLIDWDWKFSIFVSLCLLKPKKDLLDSYYLTNFLNSDLAYKQATARSKSGTITNLHLIDIKTIKIPLPPFKIQKQIVEKIEEERACVESAKKLIKIYEQKTKDAIAKVWSE
jgi:type I restriction enzyme M protein